MLDLDRAVLGGMGMGAPQSAQADEPADEPEDPPLSPVAKLSIVVVVVLLVIWFLVAWLIRDLHILDAAGESVGTAFALGVLASLVGALRGSR